MQNCAARYVSQLSLSTNRKVIFRQIRWLTVRQLIHYHTALSMFRIRRSQEPEYLSELISRENRHNNIIIPNTNLTLAKKSFCFRGPEEWNKLPAEIRNCERIGTFKLKLKSWIIANVSPFGEIWGCFPTFEVDTFQMERSPVKKLIYNLLDTSNKSIYPRIL